jgi:hypothetical protein
MRGTSIATFAMTLSIASPLTLPNGITLPNRLAKAAMEENMAESGQLPGAKILQLYRAWSDGGAGLIITGNVMVDARALTGPGGIVLEAHTPLAPFRLGPSHALARRTGLGAAQPSRAPGSRRDGRRGMGTVCRTAGPR